MCYHYMYNTRFLILVLDTEHVGVPTDCKTQCESSCAGMPAVKAGACWGLVWQVSGPEG